MSVRIGLSNLPGNLLQNVLSAVPRDALREIAKRMDIPRGRNKEDTIRSISIHRSRMPKHYHMELFL